MRILVADYWLRSNNFQITFINYHIIFCQRIRRTRVNLVRLVRVHLLSSSWDLWQESIEYRGRKQDDSYKNTKEISYYSLFSIALMRNNNNYFYLLLQFHKYTYFSDMTLKPSGCIVWMWSPLSHKSLEIDDFLISLSCSANVKDISVVQLNIIHNMPLITIDLLLKTIKSI